MAIEITESFAPNGIAVLHDSLEQPVFEGEGEQGVYGYIQFQYISVVRHVTLEFRDPSNWETFMGLMAQPENLGQVNFRGGTYFMDSPPDPEQFGGAGSYDNPVYTVTLTLRSYDVTSSSGGTGTGGGGGRPAMITI